MEKQYSLVFNKNIKKKTIKIDKKKFNKNIRALIKKRRAYLRHMKMSPNFNEKYNELTVKIGNEIEKFESEKILKLINKSDNFKSLYKSIKNVTKDQPIQSFINKI